MKMTKSKKLVLGALLEWETITADDLSDSVYMSKSTVRKTLKMFYDTGICDRDREDGVLEYKLSENWLYRLWVSFDFD